MKSKLSYLAGMLAPLFFSVTFLLQDLFRPDYDPLAMHVSALSIGRYGWIQIGNFLVLGTLLFVFSVKILKEAAAAKRPRTGPILTLSAAVCFFFSGPFVMDPMGTPRTEMSVHGLVHGLLGGIAFILMGVSCFVFFKSMKKAKPWQGFRTYTLVMGIILAVCVSFFTAVTKSPALNDLFHAWQGLIQRAVLLPYMFWVFTYAFKLSGTR